jgi:hypothetical protein
MKPMFGVADQLFATLDPTTPRQPPGETWPIYRYGRILSKIALRRSYAFATPEEITDAEPLLHVSM